MHPKWVCNRDTRTNLYRARLSTCFDLFWDRARERVRLRHNMHCVDNDVFCTMQYIRCTFFDMKHPTWGQLGYVAQNGHCTVHIVLGTCYILYQHLTRKSSPRRPRIHALERRPPDAPLNPNMSMRVEVLEVVSDMYAFLFVTQMFSTTLNESKTFQSTWYFNVHRQINLKIFWSTKLTQPLCNYCQSFSLPFSKKRAIFFCDNTNSSTFPSYACDTCLGYCSLSFILIWPVRRWALFLRAETRKPSSLTKGCTLLNCQHPTRKPSLRQLRIRTLGGHVPQIPNTYYQSRVPRKKNLYYYDWGLKHVPHALAISKALWHLWDFYTDKNIPNIFLTITKRKVRATFFRMSARTVQFLTWIA